MTERLTRSWIVGVLREPLVHFLVGGGLLFGAWTALAPAESTAPESPQPLELDAQARESILAAHAEQRGIDAVPAGQVETVVEEWIRDEVLVREARRLELDQGDTIVRRRLVQLMEFVLDAGVEVREPTDADLETWMSSNPSLYRLPARIDLTHVFVDPSRHDDVDAVIADLRARLEAGEDPASLGDPFPRERTLRGWSQARLEGEFGRGFGASFEADGDGDEWSGPWTSAFGRHLVRIDARFDPSLPALADVRSRVRADWLSDRRENVRRAAIDALVERYQTAVAP